MRTIGLWLIAGCLLTVCLQAQDSFIVMSLRGRVEVMSKGKNWKRITVGMVLGKKDIIRTSYASYVKLMMNEDRLVSVDENTTKPLAEFLQGPIAGSGEGAAGKILQYAAAQISRTKTKREGGEYGAVRGEQAVFSAVFPTRAIMTAQPTFTWIDTDSAGRYEILVLDDNFQIVQRWSVEGSGFAARIPNGVIPGPGVYHWQITRLTDGEVSNIQTFSLLPPDTVSAIEREVESLDRELTAMNADDVTRQLIHGIYFERKGLCEDAFRAYRETVRLAPDVEEYRDMMRALLAQMRLLNEEPFLLH
ncbi:MAG: hypothetical protein QHI48_02375 [Bacteroidota bacterium]|nr:hypothetical protein [Bacteroidota bacterium]